MHRGHCKASQARPLQATHCRGECINLKRQIASSATPRAFFPGELISATSLANTAPQQLRLLQLIEVSQLCFNQLR